MDDEDEDEGAELATGTHTAIKATTRTTRRDAVTLTGDVAMTTRTTSTTTTVNGAKEDG
jgi:hypothetical protein